MDVEGKSEGASKISREEFIRLGLAAQAAIEAGAPVYAASDVHDWMERRARGENAPRPTPLSR
jgi:hypothetical protein